MSRAYNLNDNVSDNFEFELDGHKYQMTYPTVDQLQELRELVEEAEGASGADAKKLTQQATDWMYGFIAPTSEGAPSIKELMGKQRAPVMRNFTNMVKAEFGVE